MRIVYIDMHCNNFLLRPFSALYYNSKVVTFKHKFIVDYALRNDITICNYISKKTSSVCGFYRFLRKFLKIFKLNAWLIEAKYVINKNYGHNNKIINICDKININSDDYVVCYLYDNKQLDIIKDLPGIKICFMNHFVAINEIVDLSKYGINALVNECDLSNNAFFKKYFIGDNVRIIVCPYSYGERFVDKCKVRKDKAFIVGTLSTCKGNSGYKLYREFFKTEWIQNQRKLFYDNKEKISDFADSYISYIREDIKEINKNDKIFIKLYKKIVNKIKPNVQSKYTSFNMVDKFNEYSMFLCPEENADMPGIGYVEGMASGAAYIGQEKPYYKSIGLVPGDNYILYDGTIEGLKSVVSYYSNHKNELEKIRIAGRDFVRNYNNAENVCKKFFKDLNDIGEF